MNLGLVAGAFGLGATLGLLPGPVQFVLLTEATRGGARRGFAAMAGANGTMGILMVTFAAGLALAPPGPVFLRILKIVGGLFLLFLAGDAIRTALKPVDPAATASSRHGGTPFLRGVFAVLLNPGAWVFLITTASAVFATAEHNGGRPLALSTAVAMLAGVALIDGTMVLLGDGFSRFERSFTPLLSPILGVALAVFGVILLVQGIRG